MARRSPSNGASADSPFSAGHTAGKGIGFLVLPILARLLALDQFGQLDVLNALVSSSLSIVMLGTDVAAVRLYFDGGRSPTNAVVRHVVRWPP